RQALERPTYEASFPTRPLSSPLGTPNPQSPGAHEKGRRYPRNARTSSALLRAVSCSATASFPQPTPLLHLESCSLPTMLSIVRRDEGCRCKLRRSSTLQLWRAQSGSPPPVRVPRAAFPWSPRLHRTEGDHHRAGAPERGSAGQLRPRAPPSD